jgi:hypothetical protein
MGSELNVCDEVVNQARPEFDHLRDILLEDFLEPRRLGLNTLWRDLLVHELGSLSTAQRVGANVLALVSFHGESVCFFLLQSHREILSGGPLGGREHTFGSESHHAYLPSHNTAHIFPLLFTPSYRLSVRCRLID